MRELGTNVVVECLEATRLEAPGRTRRARRRTPRRASLARAPMPTRRGRAAHARRREPRAQRADGSCRSRAHPPARAQRTAHGRARQARHRTRRTSRRAQRGARLSKTTFAPGEHKSGARTERSGCSPGCRPAPEMSGSLHVPLRAPPPPRGATTAVSCSPRSRATTARFAASRRSPRAAPADTRSGGPWKPRPKQTRSRCSPSTSPSAPPQPASARSTFHDQVGPSATRAKGTAMNTRIAQSEPAPGGTAPGRFSSGELAFLIGVPLALGDPAPLSPRRGRARRSTWMRRTT